MRAFIFILTIGLAVAQDDWDATLTDKDIQGPISLSADIDSLLRVFGDPKHIERAVGFCGKGPKIIDNEIVPGDSIYCDSLVIYTFDSLTICTNDRRQIQYYVFSLSTFKTTRGIHIGSPKEDVLKAYGSPSNYDQAYMFEERLAHEDDQLQYAIPQSANGIVFFLSSGRVTRIFVGRGTAC